MINEEDLQKQIDTAARTSACITLYTAAGDFVISCDGSSGLPVTIKDGMIMGPSMMNTMVYSIPVESVIAYAMPLDEYLQDNIVTEDPNTAEVIGVDIGEGSDETGVTEYSTQESSEEPVNEESEEQKND